MTIRDPEVVETLRDDPELLALADALQSAGDRVDVPGPARRPDRRPIRLAALGLAVAAAIALLLASPWDSGGGAPSLVDKALAAVGDQPVIHAVLRFRIGERIDLGTGRSQPTRYDAELWYDSERHVYRSIARIDGQVVSHTSGTGDLGPEGFLLTSTELYRKALQSGKVHSIGRTTVRGRPAIVLQGAQNGGVMRVILDADSYRLLRMQFLRGNHLEYELDVLRFETVSRDQAHLPAPRRGAGSGGSSVTTSSGSSGGQIDLDQARTVFDKPALWAGPTVDGHELAPLELDHVTTTTREGPTVRGRTLELDYGPAGPPGYEPYLKLEETPTSDAALWSAENGYAPPAGYLDLTSGQESTGTGPEHRTWTGKMRRDGFLVQLTSRSRTALIAAARSLRPVP